MNHNRKSFIISLLFSLPFLCSASLPSLEKIDLDSSVYSFNESENFIEEFKVEEKDLNSSLHPLFESDDLYYVKNWYNGSYPEFQFNDVLYSEDNHSDVEFVDIDGNSYSYTSSFINYGNSNNYYSYERKANIAFDEYYGSYYFEQSYDGSCYDLSGSGEVVKAGFSSVQGVSLISNNIYINSIFDKSKYFGNKNIDLALVNNSRFDIEFEDLLNVLSYSSYNAQFQFSIIKMDDEELVNLICNGNNAYLVTHNCEFSFSEDNNKFYLSIPYREYIEKITISIPFFIGGFSDYLVLQDFDGNEYAKEYLVGSDIRNEIYQVMTNFKPYLFNDDINDENENYIKFCPIIIDDIDRQNNILTIKSILNGEFDKYSSIKFDYGDEYDHINLSFDKKINSNRQLNNNQYIENTDNYSYWNDYYIYKFKFNGISNLSSTKTISLNDFTYTFNLTNSSNNIVNTIKNDDRKFQYFNDYSAYTIYADAKYELYRSAAFMEFWKPTWVCDGVWDEFNSYREFLYFDFYWDESLNNRIEKIESIYVTIPKKDGSSIRLDEKNLQYRFDNFLSDAGKFDQFLIYYNSAIEDYKNFLEVDLGNMSEGLRDYLGYHPEFGKRFVYSNYCGNDKNCLETYGIDKDSIEDNKTLQAQLLVYTNADTIVKATSNKDGLHVEFDDTGKVIGVYDGSGNLSEDYYFDEEDGFIKDIETDEILGDNNVSIEDVTDNEIYDEYNKENWYDLLFYSFNELSTDFQKLLKIVILVASVCLIVYLVFTIFKAFRNLTLHRNVKSTNKMLKEFRKRRK